MNKYTAHGLAEAAQSGRRILVLTDRPAEALDQFRDLVPDATVRRTNGDQRIRFSQLGVIYFASARSNRHRGRTFDTLYIDDPQLDWSWHTTRHQYEPCLSSSPDGEVIRP
ncbi:hypothetical protein [Agrococcus casei]|uniref:hypothetical protein n=1 Tax=Agrococcus casei TaxID=343512 RepID=UPI003F93D9AA